MGHQLYNPSQPLGLSGRGNNVLGGFGGGGPYDPPMFPAREAGVGLHLPGESRFFPGEPVAHSLQPDKAGGRHLIGGERYMYGDRAPSEHFPVETGPPRYLTPEANQRPDLSKHFPVQSTSQFLNGGDLGPYKGTDMASFGTSSYFPRGLPSGLVSPPSQQLQQVPWPALESLGALPGPRIDQAVTGVKRPNEEDTWNIKIAKAQTLLHLQLYSKNYHYSCITESVTHHPNFLGTPNTFGQNEAILSVNALAKRPRMDGSSDLPIYPQRPGEKDCVYYMTTRTCKFGAACKFDHPVWVPAGGIPDWKEVTSAASSDPLPERPGEPECTFYVKTGICKFGRKCKFHHPKDRLEAQKTSDQKGDGGDMVVKSDGSEVKPATSNIDSLPERPGEPECAFFIKTGTCKFGATCKFNHPKDRLEGAKASDEKEDDDSENLGGTKEAGTAVFVNGKAEKKFIPVKPAAMQNSKGLPIRPGEGDCPFYIKTGSCKYGQTCRFNHPDRQLIIPPAAVVPFAAPNPLLSAYPGVLPGSGLACAIPPQRPGQSECSFYMKTGECKFGVLCKFHHPLNRLNPAYPQPGEKLNITGLPRREGEVACPHYMKTGNCKYGANCKFDHPSPEEAQQPVKLSLAGLPRRDGVATCPFYMKTGACKYGETCKFDHPPPGEAVAKAVADATTNDPTISDEDDELNLDSGIAG